MKNFLKSPNFNSNILLYSSIKSYISPKIKYLKENKNYDKKIVVNKSKEKKGNISPLQSNQDSINKNIKNQLYNIKNNEKKMINIKKNDIKRKQNYKKKLILNKKKLDTNRENKNSNNILGSLLDNDNDGTFDYNSIEKGKIYKGNNHIMDKNNNVNNININNVFERLKFLVSY